MITFTKTITTDEGEREVTYRKMDEKMFQCYCQNSVGMTNVVRNHFKIPDDKNFSVSMWPEDDLLGCVYIAPKTAKKIE